MPRLIKMSASVRKASIAAHIGASVGWLGATVAVLAVGVVGLVSDDIETIRSAYVSMDVLAVWVLVPLAFASLITGVIESLATRWGLFRYYWVIGKLALNVGACIVLVLFLDVLGQLADIARSATWSASQTARLNGPEAVGHGVGALVLLVTALVLGVYKPRGQTVPRSSRRG